MLDWPQFLTSFLGGAAASGVFAVFIGAWVNHKYAEKLERLRSDIRVDAFRNETQFARLQQDRADAIALVYAALRSARSAAGNYMSPGVNTEHDNWDNLRVEAWRQMIALEECFRPREVYFPDSTSDKIEAYLHDLASKIREFQDTVQTKLDRHSNWPIRWGEIGQHLAGQSTTLFKELRNEFRHLLGDKPASDATPSGQ